MDGATRQRMGRGMICCPDYPGLRPSGLPRATNLAPRWRLSENSIIQYLSGDNSGIMQNVGQG